MEKEKIFEFIEDELKDFISIEEDEDGVCLRRVNDFDGWEGEDLFGVIKLCLKKGEELQIEKDVKDIEKDVFLLEKSIEKCKDKHNKDYDEIEIPIYDGKKDYALRKIEELKTLLQEVQKR